MQHDEEKRPESDSRGGAESPPLSGDGEMKMLPASGAASNGNGQPEHPQLPGPNMEIAAHMLAMLQHDNELAVEMAANLAWLQKHPDAGRPRTEGQYQRRVDYMQGLDQERHEILKQDLWLFVQIVITHLSKYMTPQEQSRIIVPGQQMPPGGGIVR